MTLLILSLVLAGCAAHAPLTKPDPEPPLSSRPDLTIIFPRPTLEDTLLQPGDTLIIVDKLTDSLFAFGSVKNPASQVTLNGVPVEMHSNGGWLGWAATAGVDTLTWHSKLEGLVARTVVTIRCIDPSNEREIMRQVAMIAPVKQLELWELPRRSENIGLVVTSPTAKFRVGWPGTTNLYPDSGTVLWAVGSSGSGDSLLWNIDLPGNDNFWIEGAHVTVDSTLQKPEIQVVHKAVSNIDGRWTNITVPLGAKVPWKVERVDDFQLELTLYGAVSWTDVIIQPTGSRVVDEIRWSQPEAGVFRLTATIQPEWLWGWKTSWSDDSTFVWSVREAPEIGSSPFEGLTILVDPGHGGSNMSAIGPTGYWESRANLPLAMAIAGELKSAGATVQVSRTEDVDLDLLSRVVMAQDEEIDLLLSVHHNGLPQGKNPFTHHGSSLHYVHRHAKPLADALYESLTANGRQGDGVRYQDLALARPSWLPAVLIEASYLLHPEEERAMRTPEYRSDIARRVRNGYEKYFIELRKRQQESMRRP